MWSLEGSSEERDSQKNQSNLDDYAYAISVEKEESQKNQEE